MPLFYPSGEHRLLLITDVMFRRLNFPYALKVMRFVEQIAQTEMVTDETFAPQTAAL
jgi:hypothetical protein